MAFFGDDFVASGVEDGVFFCVQVEVGYVVIDGGPFVGGKQVKVA
jgi:hypothetical protein